MKVEVLVPCYKRVEYTRRYLPPLIENTRYPDVHFRLVDDGSQDGTAEFLQSLAEQHDNVKADAFQVNFGLRWRILEFWDSSDAPILAKMDNDCEVPEGWLTKLVETLEACPELGIVSPVIHTVWIDGDTLMAPQGKIGFNRGRKYWEALTIGGLWCMKRSVLESPSDFVKGKDDGITGAHELIKALQSQGVVMGWLPEVVVQHVGYHKGTHGDYIDSPEHREYNRRRGGRKMK